MFARESLRIVRPGSPAAGSAGLVFLEGEEECGFVVSGRVVSPESGEKHEVKGGYLDLLGWKSGVGSVANFTNYLPGAGRAYEPLWRVRSLSLLTGSRFTNEREVGVVRRLVGVEVGGEGLYLDLGCSSGLYTRSLARILGESGDVMGIDISPSMLREAARRTRRSGVLASFARADAQNLPFADASFDGAVCGGSLNEFGDPGKVLRETHRVLKPGGRVAIMGILRAGTRRGQDFQRLLSTGGVRFFSEEEVESMLSHCGLDLTELQTFGSVFFAGATKT